MKILCVKRNWKDHNIVVLPSRAVDGSAGHNLYAADQLVDPIGETSVETYEIPAHMTMNIPTGVSVEIPRGYIGILSQSTSIPAKDGLYLANCGTIINHGYHEEIIAAIRNDSNVTRVVKTGDPVAKIFVVPVEVDDIEEKDSLEESNPEEDFFD